MGGTLTIDKHNTQLTDWLEVNDKLNEITFQAEITTHLCIWKILPQQYAPQNLVQPLDLTETVIFQDNMAYVIGLVIKDSYQKVSGIDFSQRQSLLTIIRNIENKSYQNYVKKGQVGTNQYYTYAFLGKQSKNSLRMLAMSYALKVADLFSSEQKMKIMTGGGVYKSKKLQMGSLLYFGENSLPEQHHQNAQINHIHIFQLLVSSQKRQSLSIFNLKPKQNIPVISPINNNKAAKPPLEIPSLKIINKPQNKPPSLKLDLKPFQEPTYSQIQEEQSQGQFKFDIRATARHELQMEKFSNDCTKIIDRLYVSGQKVAKDQTILDQYEITQIVNCAGDYCDNYFEENSKFNYLTFFLKDSQVENIECLFYRVIDFINIAHRANKNVLVHCIQGISRSVSFIIAYLIFMNGFDYKKAQDFVKNKRKIACPNNGFMVELIQFYKRLYDDYNSLPSPRVYLVSSHCQETPSIITARLLKYSLFDKKKFMGLDCRGMYIIHCKDIIYLWVGSRCEEEDRLKSYWTYSQNYIKKLQEHEKAPIKVKAISQKKQGIQFLSLWNLQEIPYESVYEQYNKLFVDQKKEPAKPGYLRKYYEHDDEVQTLTKERLFIYPDFENGLGVFQMDDLSGYCILVKVTEQNAEVYLWKSDDWANNGEAEQGFVRSVIESHYSWLDPKKIQIRKQGQPNLSQSFINCFS